MVDLNQRALDCSNYNMESNGIYDVEFVRSNWFDGLEDKAYDLICCNPPFEWRTDDEKDYRTLSSYGGEVYGLDQTLEVLKSLPSYLTSKGVGYILCQTIITKENQFLIKTEIENWLNSAQPHVEVVISLLFEHLLSSESQMRQMRKNSFSHFTLVVIEIKKSNKYKDYVVSISDARPWAKRFSDRYRVKACNSYWDEYFNNN